jgi:phosphoglycolate phosphatase
MKLLLFDVDATLILTGGAGLHALNRTFKKLFDVNSAMDDVAPHGKTDPAIIREVFQKRSRGESATDENIARVLETYLEFLRDEVERSTTYRVLPGIESVLQQLAGNGEVLLGLATGNVESGARIKLQRGDLNRFFEFGGYGSDSEDRTGLVLRAAQKGAARYGKPIESRDVFVIGDTPLDIDAGKAAGFRTVGVATGQYSVEQLRASGADLAIADFQGGRDHFFRSTFIE